MKSDFYMGENGIISRQNWEDLISDIQKSIKEDLTNHSEAKKFLKQAIVKAVEERLPDEKFGIMFSGGVDSSLIALTAKKTGKDFICYTAGFQEGESKEPEDIIFAKKAAEQIGIKLKVKVLTLDDAHEIFKKTVNILGKELNNVVNVGVGSVEITCIEMAKQDNVKYLFSGLGSEEIFAGYERHKLAENKQQECWKGLKAMYERDLLRDNAIARSEHIFFLTPFLDKELIGVAMRIPDSLKIDDNRAKIIIREAAENLGLSKEIAWRKKTAAQYGSRLDKAISKLAKQKGFEYKKDYLKSLE